MGRVRVATAVFGAPRFLAKTLEHTASFHKKMQNRGAPKTAVPIPTATHPIPRGPKSWKISRSPSGIEIFKRDWNEWHFQARLKISSEPPTKPLFLWAILKARIEKFKRDWSFQARLQISSENLKFSSVQARLIFFKIRALWVPHLTPSQERVQSKGLSAIQRGHGSCCGALGSPCGPIGSACGPSVSLTGPD